MSKYGTEMTNRICKLLEGDTPRTHACAVVGINFDTFCEWMKKPEFSDAIKKAEAVSVKNNVGTIKRASKKNWTAAAWLLERRHAAEFSIKSGVDVDEEAIASAIAAKFVAIVRKIAPDICPACKTRLDISPKIAEELLALSGKVAVAK